MAKITPIEVEGEIFHLKRLSTAKMNTFVLFQGKVEKDEKLTHVDLAAKAFQISVVDEEGEFVYAQDDKGMKEVYEVDFLILKKALDHFLEINGLKEDEAKKN